MQKIIPLADRVLVKRLVAKAQTATGILLPETSVAKANQGKVLACGPGRLDTNGKLIPMNCKVGDRVLLPEYGGTPFKMGDEEYTLFCDCDILGKFEYSCLFGTIHNHNMKYGRKAVLSALLLLALSQLRSQDSFHLRNQSRVRYNFSRLIFLNHRCFYV